MVLFKVLMLYILYADLQIYIAGFISPNKALFDYVTGELIGKERRFIRMLPKDITHSFNVSFVFPKMPFKYDFRDPASDVHYCFQMKMKRKVRRNNINEIKVFS